MPADTTALVVIADGRDTYLDRCVQSTCDLHGTVDERWLFDDSGDDDYRRRLASRWPGWRVAGWGPRRGACAAVQFAWRILAQHSRCRYVFHLEQDFTIVQPVRLDHLIRLLNDRPELAQVVLRRQPCNPAERAAGGVVEQHPDWYTDMVDTAGRPWLQHRAYWSNNPCLYRQSVLGMGWPDHVPGRYGEDTFHRWLMAHGSPEVEAGRVRYAYWGARDSQPATWHIGEHRSVQAKGY